MDSWRLRIASGWPTNRPLARTRSCGGKNTITSEPLEVISSARRWRQIKADGLESRLVRCINARDAGPSGGRSLELGGHGGEEGTTLAVPSEASDGNR